MLRKKTCREVPPRCLASRARCASRVDLFAVSDTLPPSVPFATRLLFAWACFFRVLFASLFAGRVWAVRDARLPPAPPQPVSGPTAPASPPPADGALQLLALFQREGRLVDFL